MNNMENFNPLPRKEGDVCVFGCCIAVADFNPLPRKEGDEKKNTLYLCDPQFQSTPS